MSFNPKGIKEKIETARQYWPYIVGVTTAATALAYSMGWLPSLSSLSNYNITNNNNDTNSTGKRNSLPPSKRVTQLDLPYRDSSGATRLNIKDLSNKLSVQDIDVSGKRILVRTDFNVLIGRNGFIEDTARVDRAIPTIRYLLEQDAKCVVILTHIGRPTGEFDRKAFSTQPLIPYLRSQLPIDTPIEFLSDCAAKKNVQIIDKCRHGTVFLCENLRFHIEEVGTGIVQNKKVVASIRTINKFAKRLSSMGDVYVFEAYGAAHRPHTSIVNIQIPIRVAGLNMAQELRAFKTAMSRAVFSAENKKKSAFGRLTENLRPESNTTTIIPATTPGETMTTPNEFSTTSELDSLLHDKVSTDLTLPTGDEKNRNKKKNKSNGGGNGNAIDNDNDNDNDNDKKIANITVIPPTIVDSSEIVHKTAPALGSSESNLDADADANADADVGIDLPIVSLPTKQKNSKNNHNNTTTAKSSSLSVTSPGDISFDMNNNNNSNPRPGSLDALALSIQRQTQSKLESNHDSITASDTDTHTPTDINCSNANNTNLFESPIALPFPFSTTYPIDLRAGSRFVVIIGSALRVSDKVSVIRNILQYADDLIITGGMAMTFKSIYQTDLRVGTSLIDFDAIADAEILLKTARRLNVRVHLPYDHRIAESLEAESAIGLATDETGAPDGWIPLDIGPASSASFSKVLSMAHTVIWVGTVGCFEWGPFSAGTLAILEDLVTATKRGAYTLIAGGDAATAARNFYIGAQTAAENVSFVSSGGGSSLVMLEGKLLHGAEMLNSSENDNENDNDNENGASQRDGEEDEDEDDDDDDDDDEDDDDEDDEEEEEDESNHIQHKQTSQNNPPVSLNTEFGLQQRENFDNESMNQNQNQNQYRHDKHDQDVGNKSIQRKKINIQF